MVGSGSRYRRRFGLVLIGTSVVMLAGCEPPLPEATVDKGDIRNAIAKGQLTSPRAATMALVSLEGAPDGIAAQFRQALTSEAANREITITDAPSARYLVRGYLSAYAGEGGVTTSYTYDVFDAAGQRRQARVADTIELPAQGDDPWTAVSPSVITSLAARSADDLAVTLAGTPEAQAGEACGRRHAGSDHRDTLKEVGGSNDPRTALATA